MAWVSHEYLQVHDVSHWGEVSNMQTAEMTCGREDTLASL